MRPPSSATQSQTSHRCAANSPSSVRATSASAYRPRTGVARRGAVGGRVERGSQSPPALLACEAPRAGAVPAAYVDAEQASVTPPDPASGRWRSSAPRLRELTGGGDGQPP